MRILIVDNDPLVRWALRRSLSRFTVDEAGGAAEALAAVAQRIYDAVVVDVCLAGGGAYSGVGLARTLRARSWAGALILISGFAEPEMEREALAAGADAFVSKADLGRGSLREALEQAVSSRTGSPVEDSRPPTPLEAALQDVLDCTADETGVHAEKAYYLALFAKIAVANAQDAVSVETCARLLGVTGETLRKYAIVATRWSPPELWTLLVERSGPDGARVSVSHLYELARLPLRQREPWIERILNESLSVRALQEALGGKRTRGADPPA